VLQIPVSGLDVLADAVQTATSAVCPVAPDAEPPFRGHLTLGRADRRNRLDARGRADLANRPLHARFLVDAVDLVVSTPTPRGHQYSTVERFPLGLEPPEEGKMPT
jgi:2'-5' RNA ligase